MKKTYSLEKMGVLDSTRAPQTNEFFKEGFIQKFSSLNWVH